MKEVFGYLDHNILDSIRKNDPFGIKQIILDNRITPVYSWENLKEIKRSVGSEDEFIALLNELSAKYIEPILENNQPTGSAKIHDEDAFSIWSWFLEHDDPEPDYGYGLKGMLEKFYGGRTDESYSEIFSKGSEELQALFDDALGELDSIDVFSNEMKQLIEELPKLLKNQYKDISDNLDGHEIPLVKQLENATGLGAKVLKNIKPPNVIEKVFEAVQNSMPSVGLDIDAFFGVEYQPYEANSDREKTLSEKVNGIYHQLNSLGYFRDSDMKKPRGFNRSSSDMTHAGMASFCHLLLCRDEGLVKKTAAAYEYLGIGTRILYFSGKP